MRAPSFRCSIGWAALLLLACWSSTAAAGGSTTGCPYPPQCAWVAPDFGQCNGCTALSRDVFCVCNGINALESYCKASPRPASTQDCSKHSTCVPTPGESNTCVWSVSPWPACPTNCKRTRTVTCLCGGKLSSSKKNCKAVGAEPDKSEKCYRTSPPLLGNLCNKPEPGENNPPPPPPVYRWKYSEYGTCEVTEGVAQCGKGFKTRTATCVDSQGNLATGRCSGAPEALRVACEDRSKCVCAWKYDEWSSCDAHCRRSRTATCLCGIFPAADSACGKCADLSESCVWDGADPSCRCPRPPKPHCGWVYPRKWSQCSSSCGGGVQTREPFCWNVGLLMSAADLAAEAARGRPSCNCGNTPKPPTKVQACNQMPCPASDVTCTLVVGDPSACIRTDTTGPCGAGQITTLTRCVKPQGETRACTAGCLVDPEPFRQPCTTCSRKCIWKPNSDCKANPAPTIGGGGHGGGGYGGCKDGTITNKCVHDAFSDKDEGAECSDCPAAGATTECKTPGCPTCKWIPNSKAPCLRIVSTTGLITVPPSTSTCPGRREKKCVSDRSSGHGYGGDVTCTSCDLTDPARYEACDATDCPASDVTCTLVVGDPSACIRTDTTGPCGAGQITTLTRCVKPQGETRACTAGCLVDPEPFRQPCTTCSRKCIWKPNSDCKAYGVAGVAPGSSCKDGRITNKCVHDAFSDDDEGAECGDGCKPNGGTTPCQVGTCPPLSCSARRCDSSGHDNGIKAIVTVTPSQEGDVDQTLESAVRISVVASVPPTGGPSPQERFGDIASLYVDELPAGVGGPCEFRNIPGGTNYYPSDTERGVSKIPGRSYANLEGCLKQQSGYGKPPTERSWDLAVAFGTRDQIDVQRVDILLVCPVSINLTPNFLNANNVKFGVRLQSIGVQGSREPDDEVVGGKSAKLACEL